MADPSTIPRTSAEPSCAQAPEGALRLPRAQAGERLDMALIRARLGAVRRVEARPEVQAHDPQPELGTLRAAVALIVRQHDERGPEVLFIRRAEHPRDPWSGHMAFPGGREEPSDGELLQTAIRETREEVSLDLSAHAALLGRLQELPAMARGKPVGLTITPFVFELARTASPAELELTLNGEVSEAVWAPLEPLLLGQRTTSFTYELAGPRVELPAFDVAGRVVWGLTHRMLESLFALLR